MKNLLLTLAALLMLLSKNATAQETFVGTFAVNYRYNAAGCPPNGGPDDGNPYHCPSGIPPGPYFIDAAPGLYKLVVDAGFGCGVWSGNSSTGTFAVTGHNPGEIVMLEHQFGQIVLFFWDWYVFDNDASIQTTVSLYRMSDVPPSCVPAPSGLVAWFPANGNANDVVGGYNGTLQNGATFAAGKVGQAFSFNGTGAYVTAPSSASLTPVSLTIEGWFNFASPDLQVLISKTAGPANSDSYVIYYQPGLLIAAIGTPDNSGENGAFANWLPALGTWYHIAFTFDDASHTGALYVDGVKLAVGHPIGSIGYDDHPLILGADIENGVLSYFFAGAIDEVSLYGRALSEGDIQAIHEAGGAGKCSENCAPLGFTGFLSPIGGSDATGGSFADPLRTFKLKSTIPVKFTASCNGSPVLTGVHTLRAIKWSSQTDSDPAIDATPTDAATIGNEFRLVGSEWHYNLDTKAMAMSTGKWQLIATLSDGSQHSVWIQIK